MLLNGKALNRKGSLSSITDLKKARRASEEPDLLTDVLGNRKLGSNGEENSRKYRRKGLRKRFLSLTEGISSFFSPEKKNKESLSGKGSRESLQSLQQSFTRKFPSHEEINLAAEETLPLRRHAASFSSFRPPKDNFLDESISLENSVLQDGRSPPLDRLKKAPPSPPPRRYSFWLTPNPRPETNQNDPLARAVLSSSFANLPHHLRPPPPPPPIRFGNLDSPYLSSSKSRFGYPTAVPSSPLFLRERSLPADRITNAYRANHRSILSPLDSFSSSYNGSVLEKTVSIILQKENGTFGFTVRGGMSPNGSLRPLQVTHVKPGGPADREGSLKAGDRLIALDGRDLTRCTLIQAQIALQEVEYVATLAIRFDISVMDSVRCEGNALLVEIERSAGASLGITLNNLRSPYSVYNYNLQGSNSIAIESIRTASIAERCGALCVGDIVRSVNGVRLDQNTLKEVNLILCSGQSHKVSMEVIPNTRIPKGRGSSSPSLASPLCSQRLSTTYDTIAPNRTIGQKLSRGESSLSQVIGSPTKLIRAADGSDGVNHTETFRVTLLIDCRGVGMAIRPAPNGKFPLVTAIDPGGVADKCGVICVGDRILGVNGRNLNGVGVSDISEMMATQRPTVVLDIEVDVADSVIPSSGTFSIKLSKRSCCHGITLIKKKLLNARGTSEEVYLISNIVSGSSAHRSGTLQVGDQIIAIDNSLVDSLTLEQTRSFLDLNTDVVTLRVQKDDLYSDDSQTVTYTVQLQRDKGILGISATGSEDPFEPILVGGIIAGSLAAQTEAIHVGDRLLSINGISLRGKPLSEAIRLLQGKDETVTLKISKSKLDVEDHSQNEAPAGWAGFQEAPALSVDSAVESWGSGGTEPHPNVLDSLCTKPNSTPQLFSSNCGSTVRRKRTPLTSAHENQGQERRSWGSSRSSDSGQSEDGTDWDKMIADLNQISSTCGLRNKSVIHDKNGNVMTSDSDLNIDNSASSFKMSRPTTSPERFDEGTYSVTYAAALHCASSPSNSVDFCKGVSSKLLALTLTKDPFYEDFGFSVSDGLYEKGVYVNRIRKGGPAHVSGLLKPYDRILQVNEIPTEDFDCCLTVPLIAAAEDSLFLKISRTDGTPFQLVSDLRTTSWLEGEDEEEVCTGLSLDSKVS